MTGPKGVMGPTISPPDTETTRGIQRYIGGDSNPLKMNEENSGRQEVFRGSGDPPDLSYDTIFALLANSRRRAIIRILATGPADVIELDEMTEALQTSESPSVRGERDAIAIECLHVHLPKLADAGVVEYDPRSEIIRYHRNPRLEGILDSIERCEA
jgi:DNA-binding transcriptional ArsR family regulator